MKQLALNQFPMPVLTGIGLLLFFFVFVGVVIWTYQIVRKSRWDEIANGAIEDATPIFAQVKNEKKR